MKWFFGFNAETDWYVNYFRYIKCAVNSCIANTSLEPHFLYDGAPGGEELEPVLRRMWESSPIEYKKFYDLAIGYERFV